MSTVEDLSQLHHNNNNVHSSIETILNDSSLSDINKNTVVSITKSPTNRLRSLRHAFYGLPLKSSSIAISSSPPLPSSSPSSFLFYQLCALSVLSHQSNETTGTSSSSSKATTSFQTNVSLSIQPTYPLSHSVKITDKRKCFSRSRYQSICIFILILILFLTAVCLLIITSKFGIRLSSCSCPDGYERSLLTTSCTCIDRNECFNGAGYHTCTGLNMQCINTMGSYICRCRVGFIFTNNQNSCIDINECDLYKPCNTSISTCINLPGRYYCQCLISQTNNDQCIPKNICEEQNNLCGPHSECVASSSNEYQCQCLPGHIKFGNGQCRKINECALEPSVCERGRSCILTRDRFDCCILNVTQSDTGECSECGLPVNRRQARIVNGDHSYRGQWPWMAVVGVYFRDDTNHWINISQKCAATLISNRYLLTAAHCLSNQLPTFDTMRLPNRYQSSLKDTYRVSFDVIDIENDINNNHNNHNRNRNTNEQQHQRTFTLEHACIHPGFNHNTLLHDIAILKLKQPIVRNSLIDTICLPNDEQIIENGTKVWVAGWGSNAEYSSSLNVLMHADLQILPSALCPSIESTDYQICAGWSDGKKDACRGDSGGPLMVYNNNRWHIIGIVSFGDGCSRANSGGIYTRISAYHKWILEIMSSTTVSMNCSSSYDYTQILTDVKTST